MYTYNPDIGDYDTDTDTALNYDENIYNMEMGINV